MNSDAEASQVTHTQDCASHIGHVWDGNKASSVTQGSARLLTGAEANTLIDELKKRSRTLSDLYRPDRSSRVIYIKEEDAHYFYWPLTGRKATMVESTVLTPVEMAGQSIKTPTEHGFEYGERAS